MISRRFFCGCLAGALSVAAVGARGQSLECAVYTPERQHSTSPDDAIELLKAGNARFVADAPIHCDLMAQVNQTAAGRVSWLA